MKGKMPLLWSLLPAVLGTAAAVLLTAGLLPDLHLVFTLSGDLAGLALAAGLLLSAALFLLAWRRDVRWQRRLDAARADRAEERRQFLQRLDHEVRGHLTVLRGVLASLDPRELPPAAQEAASTIHAHVQYLRSLLDDLHSLAGVESGPIEHAEVDTGTLVREAVDLVSRSTLESIVANGPRTVSTRLQDKPRPLPPVWGDHELLLRALYNVVENACKFTPPGDPVEVWAFRDGPTVLIRVIDKGPGIPAEDLPHVGKELFRGKMTRSIPGSGLGLAMTQAIVRRHGGSLEVESELGAGTAVTIRLPAFQPSPVARR